MSAHIGAGTKADAVWVQRWARILDRIEFRQADVGLRYSGPPLWLEVTMTGPNSDSWPTATRDDLSWDWQSIAPCPDVDEVTAAGADDDTLLAAVSRYTIENLILNAVHEIGEWFRLDGRRVFPAHIGSPIGATERDVQGNGDVEVRVTFGETREHGEAPPGEAGRQQLAARLAALAPLFTYLPGSTISVEPVGPALQILRPGGTETIWQGTWSSSTLEATAAPEDTMASVACDVHRAVVLAETDRICRAFHVDHRQRWRLLSEGGSASATAAVDAQPLVVGIWYRGAEALRLRHGGGLGEWKSTRNAVVSSLKTPWWSNTM